MGKVPAIVVILAVSLACLAGCNSRKDKGEQASPVQNAAAPQPAGKASPAAPPKALPQDEAEAAALKEKVLAHLKAGDFAAIYNEASPGFREIGPEQKFTELWQQQFQQTGRFKEAKEISHTVRPEDKYLIYIYQVQYEKMAKELRLTFGRSTKKQMYLTGINQRDPR